MSELKQRIKKLLKDIVTQAIAPNAAIVSIVVFLHWVLVVLWFYFNYETAEPYKMLIVGLLGGSLPAWSYGVWAARRVTIKAYSLVHEQFIKFWLKEYCDRLAREIIESDYLEELKKKQSGIVHGFKVMVIDKVEEFPTIIQKLIKFVLKKMGITKELEEQIKLLKGKDVEGISELVNREIADGLIRASNDLVPSWVIALIPLNTLLFILLWFF